MSVSGHTFIVAGIHGLVGEFDVVERHLSIMVMSVVRNSDKSE